MNYTEQQTKEVLDATIHMINTKDEIIHNHVKKIAELSDKLQQSEENKEFVRPVRTRTGQRVRGL